MATLNILLIRSWVHQLCELFQCLLIYWLYWTCRSLRILLPAVQRNRCFSELQRFFDWRRNLLTMICLIGIGCLGLLTILVHLLFGSILMLTLLMVFALLFEGDNSKADLEAEFVPDINESNLFVLQRASNGASIDTDTDADDDDILPELSLPCVPNIEEVW